MQSTKKLEYLVQILLHHHVVLT